jgi:predicted phage baseplate assembly protein
VDSFYCQAANAQIFTTREDSSQNTWVSFGDGVNGALLPTGTNNVVATYRIGGGAASPPAGKLTVIAQSYPGLRSVVNPVAVSGGSDPDPASLVKTYAPQSVLTFGRAVSVFDYQALAAQAPGVTMASASWAWDAVNLRASVTVYVAGELNVASSVQTLLASAGDPNRPVTVLPATALTVNLTMAFVVTAGMDATAIVAAVQTALCDPLAGLFSPANMGIGQPLFDSEIEAVCLGVPGVVAIQSSKFTVNGNSDAGPLHVPGDGAYFELDPSGFFPSTEVAND